MAGVQATSIALAIAAAFMFAFSASLQQSAARAALLAKPREHKVIAAFGLLGTLVRNKFWLTGLIVNVFAFAAHAAALHFGSIGVVQAVLVSQLLFALPFAARRRNKRLLRRDWFGTALVCAGLVTLASRHIPHGEVDSDALPVAVAIVVTAIVVLVGLARLAAGHAQTRTALVAVAGGCCFSTTAVLVVLATDQLPRISLPLVGICCTTVIGGLLAQEAFASGSLPTALTAMTITDPVLSYIAGTTLFFTATSPNPVQLGAAAALVVAGIVALANSPTLHDERDTTEPQATGALV